MLLVARAKSGDVEVRAYTKTSNQGAQSYVKAQIHCLFVIKSAQLLLILRFQTLSGTVRVQC